jgi:hypothetical protein
VIEEYQEAVKATISKRRNIERLKASSNIRPERVDDALEELEEANKVEDHLHQRVEGISQNLHRALHRHSRIAHEDIAAALIEHARTNILYERQLLRELESLLPDVRASANPAAPQPVGTSSIPPLVAAPPPAFPGGMPPRSTITTGTFLPRTPVAPQTSVPPSPSPQVTSGTFTSISNDIKRRAATPTKRSPTANGASLTCSDTRHRFPVHKLLSYPCIPKNKSIYAKCHVRKHWLHNTRLSKNEPVCIARTLRILCVYRLPSDEPVCSQPAVTAHQCANVARLCEWNAGAHPSRTQPTTTLSFPTPQLRTPLTQSLPAMPPFASPQLGSAAAASTASWRGRPTRRRVASHLQSKRPQRADLPLSSFRIGILRTPRPFAHHS